MSSITRGPECPVSLPVEPRRRDWVHPTRAVPETVTVVALGPTKSDFLEATTTHEPPAIVWECDELWGMNGGVNHFAGRVAYDMLWVMDHLDGEERKEPEYANHIRRWLQRFGRPLMTSQAGSWSEHPQVYEYPLEDVWRFAKRHMGHFYPYFHNSIPYVLAYAAFIGVKRLKLWGADYHHESIKRREDDKPNAEWWVAWCARHGMHLHLPASTTLCSANRGVWFYGYRDQPLHILREDD